MDSERKRCDTLGTKIIKLEAEASEVKKQTDDLYTQIEDLNAEKMIITKKCQNEVREMKNALSKDKTNYELLLKEKSQLDKDYRIVMEKLRQQTTSTMNAPETDHKGAKTPSARQEKIILEALSNRVNELEVLFYAQARC